MKKGGEVNPTHELLFNKNSFFHKQNQVNYILLIKIISRKYTISSIYTSHITWVKTESLFPFMLVLFCLNTTYTETNQLRRAAQQRKWHVIQKNLQIKQEITLNTKQKSKTNDDLLYFSQHYFLL